MRPSTLTKRLADFVIETPSASVPSEVIATARNAAIDTLGCALAGVGEPTSAIAARWVRQLGTKPDVTIWGVSLAAAPSEAAFVNAISSHAIDFDDVSPAFRGHPSASLFPVAFAIGEVTGATGKDILAAYAIGLEVGCKIGRALGTQHASSGGWHPTATIGMLASTAVAARLWGLDVDALCRAWGLAASQMGGLSANFGTMTKPFHAGHAARCAVQSAWLAREGYTANTAIFDDKKGVIATYRGADGVPLETALEQLASPWELLDPGLLVKRWPCCYASHRAIGGILELMGRHEFRPETIKEISVGFLPGSDNALVCRSPDTGLQAKFSVEYTLAALLLDGKVAFETFTDAMVQRPAARELMAKVRRYSIEGAYTGVLGYTDVNITTRDSKHSVRIDRSPGSPAWPLTGADRHEKFLDCAGVSLGHEAARKLLELAQQMDRTPDVRELIRAATTAV
jgi:2-methylcitrate dehydratase PrpD